MPPFDSGHLYDEGSHALSILKAREDLESYYGAHVVIWYTELQPGLLTDHINPPYGKEGGVFHGGINIKSHDLFRKVYLYQYIVFSEGRFRYAHDKGNSWITFTRPAVVDGNNYIFSSKNTADWMGRLRESGCQLPLSGLTIPGTHNTMAVVGKAGRIPVLSDMAQCQNHNLVEQLLMGVRSVDFRVGFNFELRHGRADLSAGRLHDALDTINNYLKSHPGETIIVGAKWDMENITGYRHPEPANLRQDIEKLFFSYSNALDITTPPMLSDTRGKMLLLVEGNNNPRGIRCNGPSFFPSIPETPWKESKKWEEVSQYLAFNLSRKDIVKEEWYHVGLNDFYLESFGDVITKKMVTPENFAQFLNPRLIQWIKGNCKGGGRARLGRVEVDFAAPDLILELVQTNFS